MEQKIGNIFGFTGGNYAGNVYDKDHLSPTLNTMQVGCKQPMIVETNQIPKCLNPKGGRSGIDGLQPSVQDRVYSVDGISTSITTSFMPNIMEDKTIVAMRGRNPDNPSDRTVGSPTEQRLEVNMQGTSNCLTSVQKDNLVMESQVLTPKRTEYGKQIRKAYESGQIQESRHNMTELEPRQDNVSNTLTTVQKDNLLLENVKIRQATKDGSIECEIGGCFDASYPNSKTRRGRVQDKGNTCPTLTAQNQEVVRIEKVGQISNDGSQYGTVIADNGLSPNLVAGTHGYANSCIATQYRIRKLTPRECWRLMDFSDEDFEKAAEVNSNTQLYKQAGNSIVVNVLVAILGQLFPGKENVYKDLIE